MLWNPLILSSFFISSSSFYYYYLIGKVALSYRSLETKWQEQWVFITNGLERLWWKHSAWKLSPLTWDQFPCQPCPYKCHTKTDRRTALFSRCKPAPVVPFSASSQPATWQDPTQSLFSRVWPPIGGHGQSCREDSEKAESILFFVGINLKMDVEFLFFRYAAVRLLRACSTVYCQLPADTQGWDLLCKHSGCEGL